MRLLKNRSIQQSQTGFKMNGAIFFSGQYGSTAQYARWIGEATGLPVFDVNDANADPSKYDFLILGSSVIIYKLTIRKWVKKSWASIENKPIILFTVSGSPAGPRLGGWIANSLPKNLIKRMDHVALRGRLNPKEHNWVVRLMLIIGALTDKDPEARKEVLEGFNFVDKSSIEPILKLVQQYQSSQGMISQQVNPA